MSVMERAFLEVKLTRRSYRQRARWSTHPRNGWVRLCPTRGWLIDEIPYIDEEQGFPFRAITAADVRAEVKGEDA